MILNSTVRGDERMDPICIHGIASKQSALFSIRFSLL